MKKLLVMILALGCVMVGFTGCGNEVETPAKEVIENVGVTQNLPAETEQEKILNIEQPIVVVDNENITFTVKSTYYDDTWGEYGLKVYLENKTPDAVMFALEDVSVNGYMCDPFWASEVAGEKKENTNISWYITSLEENDINYKEITDIEFNLVAYTEDLETWDYTYHVDDIFTLNFK